MALQKQRARPFGPARLPWPGSIKSAERGEAPAVVQNVEHVVCHHRLERDRIFQLDRRAHAAVSRRYEGQLAPGIAQDQLAAGKDGADPAPGSSGFLSFL